MAYNNVSHFSSGKIPQDLISKSILRTLAYSDIFNFPLTKEEIWKYLISSRKVSYSIFEKSLKDMIGKNISEKDNYFCFKKREKIIISRKKNIREVEKKNKIARRVASHLSIIPTIKFIGISGGLAMEDVKKDDDIDFFIITEKNKLYITRLLILVILELLKVRRKRVEGKPANKVCVNFLQDESKMSFALDRRDLYTAHEIVQLKPLFQRDYVFSKFIEENKWVKKHFVNFNSENFDPVLQANNNESKLRLKTFVIKILFRETLTRLLQIAYMKRHKDKEIVTKHQISFHPKDYRMHTLNRLRLKYQQLGLLTKA